MTPQRAMRLGIEMADLIASGYLGDLSDADMLHRPCEGANHIKWQLGHLIVSEHKMIEGVSPGSMPPLPEGFAERYTKETSTIDDPAAFDSKETLLATAAEQRAATLAALDKTSADDFDKETGVDYAPTVGSMYSMQGSHLLMHAGQWAIIRRQLGRPPLF
ncbi:MAG: DinB family protein [Planctomycetaceae bacterium]